MRLQRKTFQLLAGMALAFLAVGCSGVSASKSVSPLDFLIPSGGGLMRGLMYVPPPAVPVLPDPPRLIASASELPRPLALVR